MTLPEFNTAKQLYDAWSRRSTSDQEIQNIIAFHQSGGSAGNTTITASSTPLVRYENPVGTFGFGLYDKDTGEITPIGGGAAFAATAASVVSEEDFEIQLIRVAIADTARGADYDIGDTLAQFLLSDNDSNTSTYWRNVDPDEDNIIPAPDKTHLAAPTSTAVSNPIVLPYRYTVGAGPETEGRLRIYFDTSVSPPVFLSQEIVDPTGAVVAGATPLGLPTTNPSGLLNIAGTQIDPATEQKQDALQASVGNAADPASEANGLIALIKTILAQMRDDREFHYWTDDSGAVWRQIAEYDEGAGSYTFTDLDLAGAPYTPGLNPRPLGFFEKDVDKDPQTEPVLYDTATTFDNVGWSVIIFDHATDPSTITSQGVLDESLAPVVGATNIRPLPGKSQYWEYVEGATLAVSGDDAVLTGLTIPAALTAVPDQNIQVTLSVNPNPDVLNAARGITVAGLNQATAIAYMGDTIRFGFGTTLGVVEGESLSQGSGLLTITGRPNIQAFEALSTSTAFLPTLNAKWNRRSEA